MAPPLAQPPRLAAPSEPMLPPVELAPLMADEEWPTSVDLGGDEPEIAPGSQMKRIWQGESTGEPEEPDQAR